MGSVNELQLSQSDRGRPIAIVAVGSPGTLIHIATADELPDGYDKVQLYANNISGAEHPFNLQWGGLATSDLFPFVLTANSGIWLTVPVLLLSGLAEVRAYSDAPDVINVAGYALRAASLGQPGFARRVL